MKTVYFHKNIPTVRTDIISKYFNEIRKFPMLTTEEETHLFEQYINTKDSRIFEKIIQSNLRLVVTIAKQYVTDIPFSDLIQEGNIGLIKAAEKFDPSKGFKFSTYAVWWIKSQIGLVVYDSSTIHTPKAQVFARLKLSKLVQDYEKRGEIPPDIESLQDSIDYPIDNINNIVINSIDKPIETDDDSYTLADKLESDMRSPDDISESNTHIKNVLSNILNEKDIEITLKLFGINTYERSISELAEELHVTHEAIRLKKEKIIKKLRANPQTLNRLKQRF